MMIDSTKRARVALHDLGGDGPSVLLTHANGFCGRMWQAAARELRPGGPRRAPGFPHPTPRLAAGHSLGGAAILMAELARPGTFDRAWVYEPVTIPAYSLPREGVKALGEIARSRREFFDSRQAVYERYSSRPPFNLLDPEVLWAYLDHGFLELADGTVTMKCTRDVEATIFENPDRSAFNWLGEIGAAITVATSTDTDPPAMVAPQIADALPNATLETFEDLTHFGPFQDPSRIASSIATALFSD